MPGKTNFKICQSNCILYVPELSKFLRGQCVSVLNRFCSNNMIFMPYTQTLWLKVKKGDKKKNYHYCLEMKKDAVAVAVVVFKTIRPFMVL